MTCSGSCDSTSRMTVTIPATAASGVVNFPAGAPLPSLARRAAVLFHRRGQSNQAVMVATSTYLVPLYAVGRVTAGTWYTQTANTFIFGMNPQDAGARKLNATAGSPPRYKTVSGGAVDEVHFFVDEGSRTRRAADSHPGLAEAILDPATGRYDVQPLVSEVEDFQVAYGVDGIDGSLRDRGASPAQTDESGVNRDEWVGNVATEVQTTLPLSRTPQHVDAFVASVATSAASPTRAVPALCSVWISLVVKSSDPDFVFHGPGARGLKALDSAAVSFSDPGSTGRPYHRRLLSLAVSLRNYG